MKWRLEPVLCVIKSVPPRLGGEFYRVVVRPTIVIWCGVLASQGLSCPKDKSNIDEDVKMNVWAYQQIRF